MAQGLATSQLNVRRALGGRVHPVHLFALRSSCRKYTALAQTLMLEECALDYEAMGLILDAVKAASTLEILGLANNR